jgi:uncharacterized membrane protein
MRRVTILVLLGAGLSVVLAVVDTLKGVQGRLVKWPGDIHPIRLPHLVVVALAVVVVLAITRWTLRSDRRSQIVAIVLGILSVLTGAIFYLGSAVVLGTAAVGFGLEVRQRGVGGTGAFAILLGAAGSLSKL